MGRSLDRAHRDFWTSRKGFARGKETHRADMPSIVKWPNSHLQCCTSSKIKRANCVDGRWPRVSATRLHWSAVSVRPLLRSSESTNRQQWSTVAGCRWTEWRCLATFCSRRRWIGLLIVQLKITCNDEISCHTICSKHHGSGLTREIMRSSQLS